ACYAFLALAQCQKGTLSSGAGEEQAVNAIADVAEIGFIAALELDGGAAGETDLTEGLAHGAPVHVALAEVHPRVTVFLALEIFQMDLDDALAERANPILGIAIKHDVAHVEPGLDPLAVKLVYVGGHFEWTKQEFVPDFLDGDDDFQFFCKRNQSADLCLGARPGVAVGGLRIDDRGGTSSTASAPQSLALWREVRMPARLLSTTAGSLEESGYFQWSMFITESIRMEAASVAFLISSAICSSGVVGAWTTSKPTS